MSEVSDVARLIWLNGGQLIGKTRLQKTTYFLEELNAGFGFEFTYHHYGPYSEELASATDDAEALNMLNVAWKTSQDGTEYAIFEEKDPPSGGDDPNDATRRAILRVLNGFSAVELELAATADFLERRGYKEDSWSETRRRKGSKITPQRLARAKQLLIELDEFRK
jgi:uncharacterized protein